MNLFDFFRIFVYLLNLILEFFISVGFNDLFTPHYNSFYSFDNTIDGYGILLPCLYGTNIFFSSFSFWFGGVFVFYFFFFYYDPYVYLRCVMDVICLPFPLSQYLCDICIFISDWSWWLFLWLKLKVHFIIDEFFFYESCKSLCCDCSYVSEFLISSGFSGCFFGLDFGWFFDPFFGCFFVLIPFVIHILFLLLSIAFLTLLERKILASVQRRRGPNVVGLFGLLQAFADGIKLISKELIIPSRSHVSLFIFAPLFTFFCTILIWLVVPVMSLSVFLELPFSILLVFAISSLSVHGIIFSGWASNSKYAFLGSIRSASQMISYELSLSVVFLSIILITGDSKLSTIVYSQVDVWYILPLFPFWILFVIISLAETNRAPFDLPEAEAELVAGYNVEYSSIMFALFFLAEYGNMLFMGFLSTIFFWGGWLSFPFVGSDLFPEVVFFSIKAVFNVIIFVWVRASLPRYRYDQLMKLGWKVLLPLSFVLFFLQVVVMLVLGFFY